MRNQHQKIWDHIATLKLFEAVNNIGSIGGNLKIQKLIFLSELEGINTNIPTMYFRFFRYNLGPYSADLANDIKFLIKQGFITTTNRVTKRGEFLFEYISDAIKYCGPATQAFGIFEYIAQEFGKYSGPKLANTVYKIKVPVYDLNGEEMMVKKIPPFLDILVPTQISEFQDIKPFTDDMLNNIEDEFEISPDDLNPKNAEYQKTISQALSRIKHAINA